MGGDSSSSWCTGRGWQALDLVNFTVELDEVGFRNVEVASHRVVVRCTKINDGLVARVVLHVIVRDGDFGDLWNGNREGLLHFQFEI